MSQQLRAAALLRQAAEMLDVPVATTSSTSSTPTTTCNVAQVAAAARGLFGPYRNSGRPFQRTSRRGGRVEPAVSHWTHKLSVVPRCKQETVPNRDEKFKLYSAGQGEKRLSFVKNSNKIDFERTLEEAFPKLKDCGGYELMRTPPGSRVTLEGIIIPTGGFTSAFLADESNLGQAICYIRPIQTDLDMEMLNTEPSEPCQECLTCGDMVPMNLLRDHVEGCQFTVTTVPPEKIRRMSVQTPVCQFTCACQRNVRHIKKINFIHLNGQSQCPMCDQYFDMTKIQEHASICGDTNIVEVQKTDVVCNRSLKEALASIATHTFVSEKSWHIHVLRKRFLITAMEQLEEATADDLRCPIIVTFIGEEWVDAGGLTREFFSLLFQKSNVFENGSLTLNPFLLDSNAYNLLGKAVAIALTNGHPGPQRFVSIITKYILSGEVPDFKTINTDSIKQQDVAAVINAIETASADTICSVFEGSLSILEQTGYKKVLTLTNRQEAVTIIKGHVLLYRIMGPLLQFMEGLKLHGVLDILKSKPIDAANCLLEGLNCSSDRVMKFFVPSYSKMENEKESEEVVMYNLAKFLKKTERGQLSSQWIDIDEEQQNTDSTVVLSIGDVLQALVGSPELPTNVEEGIVNFDHVSYSLPSVNTCVPSILFSSIGKLQSYPQFEEYMKYIVIGAYGFGQV